MNDKKGFVKCILGFAIAIVIVACAVCGVEIDFNITEADNPVVETSVAETSKQTTTNVNVATTVPTQTTAPAESTSTVEQTENVEPTEGGVETPSETQNIVEGEQENA